MNPHRVSRRAMLIVGPTAQCALLTTGSAVAKTNFPEKPVRLLIGFPPGSLVDTLARLLAAKFAEEWGWPVVVESVSGAAGTIAADQLAKAPPDGHTLGLVIDSQLVTSPVLTKVAFDPVRDFAPISQLTVSSLILVVGAAVPATTLSEFVNLVKARPGELTFASPGNGSPPHLAAELLKATANLDLRHVPYRGGPAAVPDLVSTRVTMMFTTLPHVLPLLREGTLRALAVTSSQRSALAPEVPTIGESGFAGFEMTAWTGLLAPAKTPEAILRTIQNAAVKALAQPDVRAQLIELDMIGIGSSPDMLDATLRRDVAKAARTITQLGIKSQ
jgi:tripartite-type tricarboxylate transporter receptor subunit TctC